MLIIDTNIWISYVLNQKGAVARKLKLILEEHSYAFSDETFRELTEVLLREKFNCYFSKESRVLMLREIATKGNWFTPSETITDCQDSKDNKFLELALDAGATSIITGDDDLLILSPFRGIMIQRISEFSV